MKYTIQKLEHYLVKIEVEFSAEESDKLEGEEGRKKALMDAFNEVNSKEALIILTPPDFVVLSEKPLKCEISFTTLPRVTAPDLSTLKIPSDKPEEITEAEVNILLAEIQRSVATPTLVDRPAKEGDRIMANYEGIDKEGVVQMAQKEKIFDLGAKTIVADLESNLMGAKKGETKEFDVTFPSDYFQEPLAGQTLKFKVEVLSVSELEIPEWNDELVKTALGEGKTMEDMKAMAKRELQGRRAQGAAQKQENALLMKIVEKTVIDDLPQALIEDEIDRLLETMYEGAEKQGTARTELDKEFEKEGRDPRKQLQEQARQNVTLRLGLNKIFEDSKWDISDEELDAEIEKRAEQVPAEHQAKFLEHLKNDDSLREQLKSELKFNKLLRDLKKN